MFIKDNQKNYLDSDNRIPTFLVDDWLEILNKLPKSKVYTDKIFQKLIKKFI